MNRNDCLSLWDPMQMMALFLFPLCHESLEFQIVLEICTTNLILVRIGFSVQTSNTSFGHRLDSVVLVILTLTLRIIAAPTL